MSNYEFPINAVNVNEHKLIIEWIKNHNEELNNKSIYIYGAGIRGNMILMYLEKAGIEISGFLDSAPEKQGGNVKEYKIYSLDELNGISKDNIKKEDIIIIISPENYDSIENMLIERGLKRDKQYFILKSKIYDTYSDIFFRKEDTDFIVFGDCFFDDLDVDELTEETIGALLEKNAKQEGFSVKILSMHGMCTPSFYHLLKEQLGMGIIPKAVAFIINIPFCNSIQTKLPQSQHYELLRSIECRLENPSKEFTEYVKLTQKRANNLSMPSFATNNKANHENVEKMLTKVRYMYKLNEDNENIIYAKKIIEILIEKKVKPVPFIPAINYFVGEKWFGEEFCDCYGKICDEIKAIVNSYGVELLDLSTCLSQQYFSAGRMTKFPKMEGKEYEANCILHEMIGEI